MRMRVKAKLYKYGTSFFIRIPSKIINSTPLRDRIGDKIDIDILLDEPEQTSDAIRLVAKLRRRKTGNGYVYTVSIPKKIVESTWLREHLDKDIDITITPSSG